MRLTSLFAIVLLAGFMGSLFPITPAKAFTRPESGTLIRGQSFAAVYYMGADGFRYIFPNDKAYFTWYENFNNVVWLSDTELAMIQIGDNVTYKPGVKMIKIQSDPKTYAVSENGTLRHVANEEVARSLYGTDWSKQIDDVPDGFFANYTVGEPITASSQFSPINAQLQAISINHDKDLSAPREITIGSDDYSPASMTIDAGEVIEFINSDDTKHTATAENGMWGTGTLAPNDSFLRRFDEPGIYEYFCSYHTDMTGVIIVE